MGFFSIEMQDAHYVHQEYLKNSAVLQTTLIDESRMNSVEITDFCPCFEKSGRQFRPTMIIRRIKRTAGHPRIRVKLRPTFGE